MGNVLGYWLFRNFGYSAHLMGYEFTPFKTFLI